MFVLFNHHKSRRQISLLLEHDNRIRFQVGHVNKFSFLLHVLVLATHEPSYVSIEEPAASIVGIRIRLGEFVMIAMISTPFMNTILLKSNTKPHKR